MLFIGGRRHRNNDRLWYCIEKFNFLQKYNTPFNSAQFKSLFIYKLTQQPEGQLQNKHWYTKTHVHIMDKNNNTRQKRCNKTAIQSSPRRYIVGGSKTGDLVAVETSLHTGTMSKWTRWLWAVCLGQDERYTRVYKEITPHMRWQTNDNLRRSQFLLNCNRVICRWRSRIKWRWMEIKHWRLVRQRPLLLLQNTLKARTYPNNYSDTSANEWPW
jgi:hypothetical protein